MDPSAVAPEHLSVINDLIFNTLLRGRPVPPESGGTRYHQWGGGSPSGPLPTGGGLPVANYRARGETRSAHLVSRLALLRGAQPISGGARAPACTSYVSPMPFCGW